MILCVASYIRIYFMLMCPPCTIRNRSETNITLFYMPYLAYCHQLVFHSLSLTNLKFWTNIVKSAWTHAYTQLIYSAYAERYWRNNIQLTFPQNSPQRVRVHGRHVAKHGFRLHNSREGWRSTRTTCTYIAEGGPSNLWNLRTVYMYNYVLKIFKF